MKGMYTYGKKNKLIKVTKVTNTVSATSQQEYS